MVQRAINARERFGRAAMQLFREQGYQQTNVAQIAKAAGLTERTFFRYFSDKAEMLFWNADAIQAEIVTAVQEADLSRDSLSAILQAMAGIGAFFEANRDDVVARQTAIWSHESFQERELMKTFALTIAIATALEGQGISEGKARMIAEAATSIWRVAIERWTHAELPLPFAAYLNECHADLTRG